MLGEELDQFRRPWFPVKLPGAQRARVGEQEREREREKREGERERERERDCSKMLNSNQVRSSILTHHVDCIMNSQEMKMARRMNEERPSV